MRTHDSIMRDAEKVKPRQHSLAAATIGVLSPRMKLFDRRLLYLNSFPFAPPAVWQQQRGW